jgi:predicted Zn-dependent protease
MKKLAVNCTFITLCLICLAACGLTGLGSRGPGWKRLPDARVRPVNAYFLFSEAHLALKKGNLDRAIELLQQALVKDPESVYLKRELAGFWLMKKDTTAAIQLLDDILTDHPDDVDTLILAGRIHQTVDQPEAAMDAFSRVIALDPSQQTIYLQLGSMYMDQEQ